MENLEKLDQWIIERSSALDLQVKLFENRTLETFGIFDLEASINIENKIYFGRGTAFDRDLALKKACSEAIERFFLSKKRFATSNGIAVHQNYKLAIENAQSELIERDLFMCHFLTSTPFTPIEIQNDFLSKVRENLSACGANIAFYSMGVINSSEGILCTIEGLSATEPFGYILGSAAGKSMDLWQSAFLEAFRNFAHLHEDQKLSLELFLEKERTIGATFIDHGQLALDAVYACELKKTYFPETLASNTSKSSLNVPVKFEEIDKNGSIFEDAPIVVARATSDDLQNLFVGITNDKKINISRLTQFCDSRSKKLSISTLPHPFN